MKKNKIDPLKPKEDVIIKDKETGFLETLTKVVKSKKTSKKEGSK